MWWHVEYAIRRPADWEKVRECEKEAEKAEEKKKKKKAASRPAFFSADVQEKDDKVSGPIETKNVVLNNLGFFFELLKRTLWIRCKSH